MDTERIVREKPGNKDLDKALREIKDRAVMLSIAYEYLCEDPFLKKIGACIKENIEVVENHIQELKRQFVGKPITEMDLSKPLNRVVRFAERLQKPGDGIKQKCIEGDLGNDLNVKLTSLVNEINALKQRIEGKSVSYTKTDSALGFIGRFKFIVRSLVLTSKFTLRICALFIIICFIIFFYLFITMETEKGPLKIVDQGRSLIISKQTALARINAELKPLQEKIESIRKDELSRQEEIKRLDLRIKAYKFYEEQQKVQIEIEIAEKALKEKIKTLEEVRRKSFLERLLRF